MMPLIIRGENVENAKKGSKILKKLKFDRAQHFPNELSMGT